MGRFSRAQQRAEQVEQANLMVANAEADVHKGLGAWRKLPAMPSDRQWAEARAERVWPGSQPARPIEGLSRETFARDCDERAAREVPRESTRWILGAILAVFALVAVAAFSSARGMALFAILAVLVLAPELGKPSRRAGLRAQHFSSGWPTYWQAVQDEWDRFQKWPERERARAALADRVARGDLKATYEAIVEALEVQALPYELKYLVRVDDEQETFVLIELLELPVVVVGTDDLSQVLQIVEPRVIEDFAAVVPVKRHQVRRAQSSSKAKGDDSSRGGSRHEVYSLEEAGKLFGDALEENG